MSEGKNIGASAGVVRWTPAHWAAYAGSCSIMQEIFDTVSDDDELNKLLLAKDWLQKTPLHAACSSGKLRIVCMFIKLERDGRISKEVFEAADIFHKRPVSIADGLTCY